MQKNTELNFVAKWEIQMSLLFLSSVDCRVSPGMVMPVDMDKLKLRGPNLGRVFNSKLGRAFVYAICYIAYITKWPYLKLKTQPKQLLGSLPLAFVLPAVDKALISHFFDEVAA